VLEEEKVDRIEKKDSWETKEPFGARK